MGAQHIELGHRTGTGPLHDLLTGVAVDPAALGLPLSLIDRIDAWERRWRGAVDRGDPEVVLVERWVIDELGRDGARLWRALLGLLRPAEVVVTYAHRGARYATVDDLPIQWRFG